MSTFRFIDDYPFDCVWSSGYGKRTSTVDNTNQREIRNSQQFIKLIGWTSKGVSVTNEKLKRPINITRCK